MPNKIVIIQEKFGLIKLYRKAIINIKTQNLRKFDAIRTQRLYYIYLNTFLSKL